MSSGIGSNQNVYLERHTDTTSWLDEARCGKLGFSIVIVNSVASAILVTNLAIFSGGLCGTVTLGCSVVILPSIALFGVKTYFTQLFKPLQMGLGFVAAWASVHVDQGSGIWAGKFAKWAHFYDGRLNQGLRDFFANEEAKKIIDLGCGTGDYVKDLRKAGFECDGCDGNPDTPRLGGKYCKVVDLTTKNLNLRPDSGGKYDWVFSLEVGEHLPKEFEQTFLDNITRTANKGIVLSWAKEGQGGLGHVNEQNNAYIEEQMRARNWTRDFESEEKLRVQTSPHCFWFRDTVMVFRK